MRKRHCHRCKIVLITSLFMFILLSFSTPYAFAEDPKITVKGKFLFHPDGVATNSEAIKGAKVEVWDSEFPFPDQKLASGTTNEQGEYEFVDLNNDDGFLQGGMDIYVKVYAKNDAVEVHTNPWWLFGGVYEHKTSTKNDVASGDVNFGTVYTPLDDHGAWRIQNQLPIAKEFLRVQTGLNIRQTKAFYRDLFSPASSYYFGGALPHLDIFGVLPPGASLSDLRGIHYSDTNFHDGSTTWRTNEVIYHEYGHFVLDEYADSWPPTTELLHEFSVAYNPGHAWVEGFVEFFSAAVREWDGEPYDSYGLAPPIEQNHNGDNVEGSIAGILWDLYDDRDDLGDSADMEFSEIWNVIVEYDPNLMLGWPVGADHPWNIYDYWDGFSTRRFGDVNVGYLWQILKQHGIEIEDTTPPMNPVEVITPHSPGEATTNNFIYIFWEGATDTESGVASYKWALTEDPDRDLLGNLGYSHHESYELSTTSTSLRAELDPEHTYWFHLITKDRAGNWASETFHLGPFTILPKVVGPVTSLLEDAEILMDYEGKIYLNHETFIDLQVYDPHQKIPDKSYYELFNSQFDSGVKQYSQSFKLEDLTDGQYTMNFWTTSMDAQFNEPTNTKIIILDSTPPSTSHTIGSPQSSDGLNTIVTPITSITLEAVDDGAGVETTYYQISRSGYTSDWITYNHPFTISSILKLEQGLYKIEYYSTDKLGNTEIIKSFEVFLEFKPYKATSITLSPRVTGQVIDPYHSPYSSVTVELRSLAGDLLLDTETDKSGLYSLTYSSGSYKVKVIPPLGYSDLPQEVDIELSSGEVIQDFLLGLSPVADANGPYVGDEGSLVIFDGTGSSDPEDDILTYEWDLDDDGSFDDAVGATPSHIWSDDYTGTVSLRVTDEYGFSDTDSSDVTISNVAPVADANGPYFEDEGVSITLDASGSWDPGTDTLTYEWDLDNDGSHDDATGVTTTHTWNDNGVYTVGLMVTDDDGASDTDTVGITVRNVAPTLNPVGDKYIPWDELLWFQASATDPGADALSFSLGGTVPTGASITLDGDFKWTPTSSQIGFHIFTVIVTDDDGATDWEEITVEVDMRDTVLVYGGDSAGQYSDEVAVSVTLTDDITGTPLEGKTIHFTIDTHFVSDTTDASGVAIEHIILDLPAGSPGVVSEFDGDSLYHSSSDSDPFEILKEIADAEYTGDLFVFALPDETEAPVRLSAILTQENDGYPGDLSLAQVLFTVQGIGEYLVDANSLGEALTIVIIPVGGPYIVTVKVDSGNGYWQGEQDHSTIQVDESTGVDKVTGGGWISDTESINGKGNFGFTVQYNKKNAPKGNFVYIWRGNDGFNYKVKSNSWKGGGLWFTGPEGAYFAGKCIFTKIDRMTGEEITLGNCFATIDITDGDLDNDPSTLDSFAITVLDGTAPHAVILRQVGTPRYQIEIGGGNIVIHH